jgi:hypothetical protein
MDERGANIDLLFRNGLKDYEVLPPPEVWDNVQPSIKPAVKSFPLLRTAAIVTILTTMSFVAYRLTREFPVTIVTPPFVALNMESSSPVFAPAAAKPSTLIPATGTSIDIPQNTSIVELPYSETKSDDVFTASSEVNAGNETDKLALLRSSVRHGSYASEVSQVKNKNFNIAMSEPGIIPEQLNQNENKHWSIGAMASPTYYSTFSSEKTTLSSELASSEQSRISYSGGLSFSYKMNKRFSIQSGLYYSSLGQEIEGVSSFGGFQNYVYTKSDHNFEVLTSSGPIITSNPDVFLTSNGPLNRITTVYTNDVFDPQKVNLQPLNTSLIQNFSYLELPVVMRYKLIDKALDFNIIGGISYNMLIKNSVYTTFNGDRYEVGETRGLNPLTLSSSLGLGMEYSFANNLSLNLEPTFRYYLNPFDAAGSQIHPYTFGIFTGVSYRF